MTEKHLIVRRYIREPVKDDVTGCYCPAKHGFCEKPADGFCEKPAGPRENFFKRNCLYCIYYKLLHAQQEIGAKEAPIGAGERKNICIKY